MRLSLDCRLRENGGDRGGIQLHPQHSSRLQLWQCTPLLCVPRSCGRSALQAARRYFLAGIATTSPIPACQSRHDRSLRRTNKPCVSLGDKMGTAHLVAPKPKGMSQRTYQRKRVEIEWCEGQENHLFTKRFAHEVQELPVLS
jgi:hypothetical protein